MQPQGALMNLSGNMFVVRKQGHRDDPFSGLNAVKADQHSYSQH